MVNSQLVQTKGYFALLQDSKFQILGIKLRSSHDKLEIYVIRKNIIVKTLFAHCTVKISMYTVYCREANKT